MEKMANVSDEGKISNQITTGTKEWASSNVNLISGCSHDCRYCYAKKMAIRFGRKTEGTWKEMILNKNALHKNYKKRKGRIMFPSSHDITREILKPCAFVLRKLLKAGNEVLITTKPDLICIYKLISYLKPYKTQVQFRFTITSKDPKKLKFWEPGAPGIDDRLQSLKLARMKGFKTSVSIEPFLDKNPIPLILMLANDVTESIWIGKMNYIKANDLSPEEEKHYKFQRKICSWSNVQEIISQLQKLPEEIKSKIRIKDSIKNLCNKNGMEVKT